MNQYVLPLKREIWEHQGAFIKTPIIIIALITAVLLLGLIVGTKHMAFNSNFNFGNPTSHSVQETGRSFSFTDQVVGNTETTITPPENSHTLEASETAAKISFIAFAMIMLIVTINYLLSSLHADRKDSSILFWKSMPVSETQTVLTKAAVATFLIPAIAWVASVASSLIILIFAFIVAAMSGEANAMASVWQYSSITSTSLAYISTYLGISLWFLPVMGWLLGTSAFAKKAPFLIAILIPIVLIAAERFLWGSFYFGGLLKNTLFGLLPNGQNTTKMLLEPSHWHLINVVSNSGFWLGLLVTAGFMATAIWLRENRYEN